MLHRLKSIWFFAGWTIAVFFDQRDGRDTG